MTQYIKRLPPVFQTVTERQFFDATIDQVFTKKDSSYLAGYLGRRDPGYFNPIKDFYIPEPNKNRTWWQLEATAYALNADQTKSNIFFYDDLLNRINYYGGNTLNQDRLFESEYYSFGPPIDYDMFINYQNYYWIEQGLTTITITGVVASDIIGQSSYTTPIGATPAGLKLSTGMIISLPDDPNYSTPHTVENLGGCEGITLVPQYTDVTIGAIFEFLPWDGFSQTSTGRIIQNSYWDANSWDVETQPGLGDYITIERGSATRNAWSRSNKWFHIDVINATIAATNTTFPANATRALRPIIQFSANLELYNSGTQFKDEIAYGFSNNQFSQPILRSALQGQSINTINSTYNITLQQGNLVVFFNDVSSNQQVYQVSIVGGNASFTAYGTPVIEGDIVLVDQNAAPYGAVAASTWYYSAGTWQEAANDKVSVNQAPLFQLYDHNGVKLNDANTYPGSLFEGSEIFSYVVDPTPGAVVDAVLGFPILYTALGQASDIIFQNNLITDRYTYGSFQPINGYYYYMFTGDPALYNNWNLYNICSCNNITPTPPVNCIEKSKQRVIDQYVVGYGSLYQFQLSVTPYGYAGTSSLATTDILVSVNGTTINAYDATTNPDGYTLLFINNQIYVDLTTYLTALFLTTQSVAPVVEIKTYPIFDGQDPAINAEGLLTDSANGYFEIPQQLQSNPSQLEVGQVSGSDLILQFSSIISNQIGFTGNAYGGPNNYRDSRKNRSVGSYILQNVAPTLKSMLVSQGDSLDFISAIRFSQTNYTKFKNKYNTVALQLINQEFDPVQYYNNTVVIGPWVDKILNTINISNEFSNAFAYSYMVASGTPTYSETHVVAGNSLVTLTNYIDLTSPENVMYVYDATDPANPLLLLVGKDYTITDNNPIEVQMNLGSGTKTFIYYLYQNPLPTYIPSTPSKLGLYPVYEPVIQTDYSYAIPANVLIGHDGSKTVLFGDYRDALLLELERRIYNGIQNKFRNEYFVPLRVESVKTGYFRSTRYTRQEYLDITQSYLNKWCAKNRASYATNNWPAASLVTPVDELWKLYNYRDAVNASAQELNLPGNWKGIFQYYYDTISPDTTPWEMLGFSQQPSWWVSQYGAGVINANGQLAWPSTYTLMWQDLENGIVRQGPTAIYDPITLLPQEQPMWARPGLSAIIPVDASGNIIPVPTLFNVALSGNPYEPYDGFDADWIYGDGGPVEQAWMSTSGYAFNTQEFLYLMRPGPFGELAWETLGTEVSPGQLVNVPGIENPVLSNTNWQYVQNDFYSNLSGDEFFYWMRPKNADQYVHAETVNGVVQIRFGYQCWISDNILFSGADITSTFGQYIRTLDVNLANKFAGFTNATTINTYIEAVTPGSTTNTLVIPSTNLSVVLQKSPPVATYTYSGVIVRALADGTFVVYGYDLLNASFTVLDRTNDQLINVTVGGTPEDFQYFTQNSTYNEGTIVRYNGVYYVSLTTQTVDTFTNGSWRQLAALPVTGGISVVYRPVSATTTTIVPYGTILNTAQEVFDLMIGYGAWLETQGWQFDNVDPDTNLVSDWLYSAKQFLFWLNTNWAPDAAIQLSPLANSATLIVSKGYPNDVESISNEVYSILDKLGTAIQPMSTTVERSGQTITVSPTDLGAGGIYFLLVTASETEHVLIFDNTTSFNDIIYDPLLGVRQQRIRFNGFRTNGWYGKMEAPGYLIINNQLVPNYDTIVNSIRYYYDANVIIDNQSLEQLGRHLIGYDEQMYLDNMEITNNIQYMFYQGAIRQKGTEQSIQNLFRSTEVQPSGESITIYEEWALKLGNFGNTIEQVTTEFLLQPDQNSGQVVVARMNFIPSTIGSVQEILILNAEDTYTTVPKIVIAAPDADPSDPALTGPLRQATAYAVLGSNNTISRVDIIDPGYGYLSAPNVNISSGSQPSNLDRLYSVWQGEFVTDPIPNNIINISISQTDLWIVRPADPTFALEFPTTPQIEYVLPNAGYVNFDDVDFSSYDQTQTYTNWNTSTAFSPQINNTIWVASTFTGDWDVYKLVDISAITFTIQQNQDGTLTLLIPAPNVLLPQFGSPTGQNPSGGPYTNHMTNFGNLIVLQGTDPTPVIPTNTNDIVAFLFDAAQSSVDTTYNYYDLLDINGNPITATELPYYATYTTLAIFGSMRIQPTLPLTSPSYAVAGDKIWIDQFITSPAPLWAVVKASGPSAALTTVFRQQGPLINTSLFQSASIFNSAGLELNQLPVYDPFKTILPGPARQNITYMEKQDPARYNVTQDPTLFSENITFDSRQVGQLWWDLSSVRYVYYEQPKALDGSETDTDNLVYRRDNWGSIFPGSTVNIYEWVQSSVPPSQYTGTGTPKDVNTYVQVTTVEPLTNAIDTNYYFWVLGATDQPNIENRTLPAIDVALLLQSPASQNFSYFCPIQQTATNNSYTFFNVLDILAYQGNDIQIQYRVAERNDQKHAQWMFFRDGDTGSLVTDQYWNKMTDSLCGYTAVLPVPSPVLTPIASVIIAAAGSSYTNGTYSKVPLTGGSGTGAQATIAISSGSIFGLGAITGGSLYITGTYYFVPLIGGTGSGAIATITILGGNVISVTLTNNGTGYSVSDSLSASSAFIGGTGSGFSIPVSATTSSVTAVTVTSPGLGYNVGDTLSASSINIGGTGSGFSLVVSAVSGDTPPLEYQSGIIIADDLPWDLYGWDIAPWDDATSSTTPSYGLILPVPDPTLSATEQLGIMYRPRQSMFFSLTGARQVFVQAANALLQYIPIRDNNPSWNAGVQTDTYWQYVNYYASGYENAVPTVIFATQAAATAALQTLQVGTIVQVNNATADGQRYILYVVAQANPNVNILNYTEIGIENSAIQFLNTMYTTTNLYGLSVEMRQFIDALRTEVFINEYLVDQNELFFSMMNYVLSEKKNPDWIFKSSNIYIKENNLPLDQPLLYVPDQISNIIDYINDVKPYHTQIRDYTSSYVYTDVALGTAIDTVQVNTKLAFGPAYAGSPVSVPQISVDAQTFTSSVQQFIAGTGAFPTTAEYPDTLFEVPLTTFDASKVGLSTLYPYTFALDGVIGMNPPQAISSVVIQNVVAVQIGTRILLAGQDFYVGFNNDNTGSSDGTYTVYFYNNPGTSPVPVAFLWWDGGSLLEMTSYTPNSEIAQGYPVDDLVMNVDTQLPVDISTGTPTPYAGWGDIWDAIPITTPIGAALVANGAIVDNGSIDMPWDPELVVEYLGNTISYKENTNPINGPNFYRNATASQGTLTADLLAPTTETENTQVIMLSTTQLMPVPSATFTPAIWIAGERIEYKSIEPISASVYELKLVRRGTMGTAAENHLSGSVVFVENGNDLPVESNLDVWNLVGPQVPDPTTAQGPNYTSVENVPLGGLWYSTTSESSFLIAGPGISIP